MSRRRGQRRRTSAARSGEAEARAAQGQASEPELSVCFSSPAGLIAYASLSLQISSYSIPSTSFPLSTPLSMRSLAVYLASLRSRRMAISPR